MKIIVDVFGGDNAPVSTVGGSVTAVNLLENVEIVLVGDKEQIEKELAKYQYDENKIEIVDAKEVISNNESPTQAIKTKTNSSMVVALEKLKNDEKSDALVSAGSTGAVLTGALLKVGRIEGVLRPTLAPTLPTKMGKPVIIVDAGANVDSRPEFLIQFAQMGSVYMQSMYNVEKPKVALLSNGTEDKKGNELTKTVFPLLSELGINFVGNMEAREILSGDVDVVVADGFAGNVALKAIEGGVGFVVSNLKKSIKDGGIFAKIGYLFMKKAMKKLAETMDYSNYGGSAFLGVAKPVVKTHGSSNARTIFASIVQAKKMVDAKICKKIQKQFEGNAKK